MKTTVKSTQGGHATVHRIGPNLVSVQVSNQGHFSDNTYLEKNGAYVLGNALIRLAQTIEAEEGQGVRCHGDACAAGQLPCPTARACGVMA